MLACSTLAKTSPGAARRAMLRRSGRLSGNLLARSGEDAVAFQKSRQHERNQVDHGFRLAIGCPIDRGIIAERLIEIRADGDGELDRGVVGQVTELQFYQGFAPFIRHKA